MQPVLRATCLGRWLLLAVAGISLAGLAVLIYKSAHSKEVAPRTDDDEDTED